MPPADPSASRYLPALDGLRAVAVLLVMTVHLKAFVYPDGRLLPPGGYIGVDLFFVLSGFLITSLLLEDRAREGRVSLRTFYRRRAYRLFPALGVFVLVQAVVAATAGQPLRDELHFWAGAFTYTTNWVMALNWSVPANTGHIWSLAVEEQFYVVWPVVLGLAARRWGERGVAAVAAAGVLVALLSRQYLDHRWGFSYPTVYLHTETRLDGLLLGALLAWLRREGRLPTGEVARAIGWLGVAGLALFVAETGPADPFLYGRGGYTILVVAAAAVIVGSLEPAWAPARLLGHRAVAAVGRLAYSLYLWHMLVLFVLLGFLQRRPEPIGSALFVVASFVPALVSYRYVEAPLRRFGRAREAGPPRDKARAPERHPVRSAGVVALAGSAALVAICGVPAYAARDDIRAHDEAVAAAVAAEGTAATAPAGDPSVVTPDGQPASEPPSTTVPVTSAAAPTTTAPLAPPPPVDPAGALVASVLRVEAPAPTTSSVPTDLVEVVLGATLTDGAGTPLAGRIVRFDTAAGSCEGLTDAAGRAACAVTPVLPGTVVTGVTATFAGDAATAPAEASWP